MFMLAEVMKKIVPKQYFFSWTPGSYLFNAILISEIFLYFFYLNDVLLFQDPVDHHILVN